MENKTSSYVFRLSSFVLLIIFVSCQPPATNLSQKPYFDLTSFFDQQIHQLQLDSLVVVKTSEINGNTDQHQMDWTDWKREFALFYAADINKGSLIGKYDIDSVKVDSITLKVSYTATDISLRTRLLEVTYEKGAIEEVHIVNHVSNFLSTTDEELYYQPLKNYVIKSGVSNRFFGDNDFSVLGQINQKQKKYF
jgi:hypothetical protein